MMNELNEELDFEDVFDDDDGLVDLGIEDEEEAKETERRALGKASRKANFEDLDEDLLDERRTFDTEAGKVTIHFIGSKKNLN